MDPQHRMPGLVLERNLGPQLLLQRLGGAPDQDDVAGGVGQRAQELHSALKAAGCGIACYRQRG